MWREREIGATAEVVRGAHDTFASWDPKNDPDLGHDVRMMVPIFYDLAREKTKVWVVLGWTERQLRVSFEKRPSVVVRDRAGVDVTARYDIVFVPESVELYVDRVLDRGEFRALCDQHGTREAILAAL